MKNKKLSTKQKGLKYIKTLLPVIVAFILVIATTFGVTMAYYGSSSGTLSTDIILKTGVKIGSSSSISGSSAKLVPSQPVDVSISAVIEPADNKTNIVSDAILRAKIGLSIEEDIELKFESSVTVNGETGYWVLHDDGYYYLCAETKNATSGNTKLLVFNPGTAGVTIPMSATFIVPKKFGNDKGGQILSLVARFEVAQGELYTSGLSTRIPDEQMLISHPVVQEVFDSIAVAIDVKVGDIIEYGEFPQSLMEEGVELVEIIGEFNYLQYELPIVLGNDGERYVPMQVTHKGEMASHVERYGSAKSLDGREMLEGEVYLFKIEPIEWKVLSITDGVAQLWSDKVLSQCYYQDSYEYYNGYYYVTDTSGNIVHDDKTGEAVYANNYKYSELRRFLNNEFYNIAFDDTDKTKIVTTLVDNSINSAPVSDVEYMCENTKDKVYALSYADSLNTDYGFMSDYSIYDPAKFIVPTDFAVATGAEKFTEQAVIDDLNNMGAGSILGAPITDRAGIKAMFVILAQYMGLGDMTDAEIDDAVYRLSNSSLTWLRSPSEWIEGAYAIRLCGDVYDFNVKEEAWGIAPAIQIQL